MKLNRKSTRQVLAALLPVVLGGVLFGQGQARMATAELKSALERRDYPSVRRLAGLASDVNVHPDEDGNTPLQAAITQGDVKTVRILVERGADVNLTPFQSISRPLDAAVWIGKVEVVQLLLAHRARVLPSTIETAKACSGDDASKPDECGSASNLRRLRLILPLVQRAAREQQVLARE